MTIDIDTQMPTVIQYFQDLQTMICTYLAEADGLADFQKDAWQHPSGGGGLSRVIENGAVFEKGGVNFSHVFGSALPSKATAKRALAENTPFQAAGVSLVLHPNNPFIPTTHANVRFIAVTSENGPPRWWFGGGFDLTPYYPFHEDCVHWHQTAKAACDPFGETLYAQYKKWCDDYFYLPHRQETRGIGGLFFDDVQAGGFEHCFAFMKSVGDHFLKAYLPLVEKRKNTPFTEAHKAFQRYRRGRYVEFNLMYDRGTLFGLQSGGRTESILMSLPPEVSWRYNWQPTPGTPEAELYTHYLQARDWLA